MCYPSSPPPSAFVKFFKVVISDSLFIVLYCSDLNFFTSSNTINILNQYYNNNKGVVLCSKNVFNSVSKVISSYQAENTHNANLFTLDSSSYPILYGVSGNIRPYHFYSSFIPATNSGAVSIGTFNAGSINIGIALDNNTDKGRRVDLNLYPGHLGTNTTGFDRTILQSMLWAARKINNWKN